MLPTKNKIVTLSRLADASWVRTYEDIYTDLGVYINSSDDRVEAGFDNEGSFHILKMMTDWVLDIQIGDKIEDQDWIIYKVRWTATFKDITGSHGQHSLTFEYD